MKTSYTISAVSFAPACYVRTGYFLAILVLEYSFSLLIEAAVDSHPQLVVTEKDAGVRMAHLVWPIFGCQMLVTDKLRPIHDVFHWNLKQSTSCRFHTSGSIIRLSVPKMIKLNSWVVLDGGCDDDNDDLWARWRRRAYNGESKLHRLDFDTLIIQYNGAIRKVQRLKDFGTSDGRTDIRTDGGILWG